MESKKVIIALSILAIVIMNIVYASAITASIGNARMVLRAEVGDTIEKYILVKNVNDVPVDISLTPSGDFAKSIDIQGDELTLEPGEEEKVYFTIEVTKSGTTESRINIQFTPVGEKNGVGLSSTIIVIAVGEDYLEDDANTDISDDNENNEEENGNRIIPVFIAITGIIFFVLIVLMIVSFKPKKGENKSKKNDD